MGKTKHKKFKIERPKPTGLVSVKEAENDLEREQPLPNNGMIQSLLEKVGTMCVTYTYGNLNSSTTTLSNIWNFFYCRLKKIQSFWV